MRYRNIGLFSALCGAVTCFPLIVMAAEKPAALDIVEGITLRQVLSSGGWLMYVLFLMSVLTVSLIIYFSVILRRSQIVPTELRRELSAKTKSGAFDEARRICEVEPCPLSAVTLAALDFIRSAPGADPAMVKDVVEAEGGRQADALHGQIQYLMDIAAIAPMVGLLGTVFGMLRAFSGVALNIANAKPVVLASGVSQALITTAFGLMIGIPAMAFYAGFRRRAGRLLGELETASLEIMTTLLINRGR